MKLQRSGSALLIAGFLLQASLGNHLLSPDGINSRRTSLNGASTSFAIGQFEPTRPGKPGVDFASNYHSFVVPGPVFAPANRYVGSNHSQKVAGIMIAKDVAPSIALDGVAPSATLVVGAGADFPKSTQIARVQQIATNAPQKVTAINHSWAFTDDANVSGK